MPCQGKKRSKAVAPVGPKESKHSAGGAGEGSKDLALRSLSFSERTNEVWSKLKLKVSMRKANATSVSLSHLLFERQRNACFVNL